MILVTPPAAPDPDTPRPLRGESREDALRRIFGNASRYAAPTSTSAATSINDHSGQGGGASLHGRPWIAVQWDCCSTYSRVYRNPEGTAYAGRCPKCGRAVSVRVGPGGTDSRFFTAG